MPLLFIFNITLYIQFKLGILFFCQTYPLFANTRKHCLPLGNTLYIAKAATSSIKNFILKKCISVNVSHFEQPMPEMYY